jgi:lauroyl/myristoyl acyltransferase
MLCLWRDRLAEGPWSAHCRSDGLERLEREHARGRPVALACLHFGPLNVVCHCLRGRGLPLAFLRFLPSDRLPLYWRYVDRLGDRDVRALGPIAFDGSELRPALEHLRSGRILAMVVERGHGERVRLSGAGFRFDMGTGVLRMAARTGAVVMPCLITAGAGMSVAIHLGEPVPEELVSDPGRHHLACEHLFRELFAVVARYPGQAHSELIEHLRPAAVGAAVAAEVVPELIS